MIHSVRIKHVLVLILFSKVYLTCADPESVVKSYQTLITFYVVVVFFLKKNNVFLFDEGRKDDQNITKS